MAARRRLSKLAGLGLSLLLLTTSAAPSSALSEKSSKKKPKRFTAEGSLMGGYIITHMEFIARCPEMPVTQGLDGYVVEIPYRFATGDYVVDVTGTSTVGVGSHFDVSFYSFNCSQGEVIMEPPQVVPAGTRFILVGRILSAASTFKLEIERLPYKSGRAAS